MRHPPCDVAMNCVVLLGPTAVGKTAVGVQAARALGAEIISADSRQVYRGLDIGSGKDLAEYSNGGEAVPYHLIDITDLSHEYSVFDFQNGFYNAFSTITAKDRLPLVVGGTGMYVDSIVRGYDFLPVPRNEKLRTELEAKSLEEIAAILIAEKPNLHNKTDLQDKERAISAIEIERFMRSTEADEMRKKLSRPQIKPLVIGTTLPRERLREKIRIRLRERLEQGMIEEVEHLHESGNSWERLFSLGLEYRFVSEFLTGKIPSRDELYEKLAFAIGRFAKRQETWFRGMEKKGVHIHWLTQNENVEERAHEMIALVNNNS